MAQNYPELARLFFFPAERAAENGTNTKDVKEFRRDHLDPQTLGETATSQRDAFLTIDREVFEAFALCPKIEKVRIAD
jgi:hypothetical protein